MANVAGIIRTLLPTKGTEANNKQLRSTGYGDLFEVPVFTGPQAQAWEGTRYVARATPAVGGTGVVLGSYPTVFSDTLKISVALVNGEAAGGKTYVLDYLRARVITADTNGTSIIARAEVDTTNRYLSGGTALTVGNANPAGAASLASVKVGDVTCSAAGTRTHIGSTLIKKRSAPCLTVDDSYLFSFAGIGTHATNAVAGTLITTLSNNTVPYGPAAVPPGGSFLFQVGIVAGDTAPASLEWEVSWIER